MHFPSFSVVFSYCFLSFDDGFVSVEEIEDEIANDRKSLAKVFARIDSDGSGQLTLEELIEGAQMDSDFQHLAWV